MSDDGSVITSSDVSSPRNNQRIIATVFAAPSNEWDEISAANRSIGFTTGFHNHGEGPYKGLLLVESAY